MNKKILIPIVIAVVVLIGVYLMQKQGAQPAPAPTTAPTEVPAPAPTEVPAPTPAQ